MRRTSLAALVAATIASLICWATPASATTPSTFAALGDSYAAGVGVVPYRNASDACLRSNGAYGVLLAGADGSLTFLACSGANVAAVKSDQVPSVPSSATQVTLTVGGIDAGFVDVVGFCVVSSGCSTSLAGLYTRAKLASDLAGLPSKVSGLVAAIHKQAPSAKVFVTGYPKLFGSFSATTCTVGKTGSLALKLKKADAAWLDAQATNLNAKIKAGLSKAAYATFVDVAPSFVGHGICDSTSPWINSISTSDFITVKSLSLHPNAAGNGAYAAKIRAVGFTG